MNNFIIPLKDLKDNNSEFIYELNSEFFENLEQDQVSSGTLIAKINLRKSVDAFLLNIKIKGDIQISCDRCLDLMTQDIDCQDELTIKFGDELIQETENLIIVPEKEGVFDISWYLFETIVLNIPASHIHQNIEDCDQEMVKRLTSEDSQPNNNEIDPRWAKLKSILNN